MYSVTASGQIEVLNSIPQRRASTIKNDFNSRTITKGDYWKSARE
jgi:hypothetical protein